MYRNLFILFLFSVLTACCKDESLNKNVIWTNRICGNNLIGDQGIGYPIYNNTVVFHSTPLPVNGIYQSILHGLDTETGKEKWSLTNKDFYPKKNLKFDNVDYYYQYNNIIVVCDFVINPTDERFIYAIDIDAGKVLWIKELPTGYTEMGRLVCGMGKYAYVDATDRDTRFSLFKIDIETGEYSISLDLNNTDLPISLTKIDAKFDLFTFSDVYKNTSGDDVIAISINCISTTNNNRWFMALYVFNLSSQQKLYSIPVSSSDTLEDWFFGRVCFHEGKIIVGKGTEFLCFDAFEDKGILWQHNTGPLANDNAMQVLGSDNLALGFSVDRLFAYDINSGNELYDVSAAGSNTAAVIDGIIYQRDHSDFQMRDPKTGKELERIATGGNEQAFSNSRPNGADGRIYIHTYSDAYCIKAWGK
jgi:outer membrane protein assembly factor BamB